MTPTRAHRAHDGPLRKSETERTLDKLPWVITRGPVFGLEEQPPVGTMTRTTMHFHPRKLPRRVGLVSDVQRPPSRRSSME